MIERIERIARVKPIDNDVNRSFAGRGYRDNKDSKFAEELRRALNKKNPRTNSTVKTPEPYNLELTNANVPLFYFGSLDLPALLH